MTSLKSDQAKLIQRVKVNQTCPLSYLVVLVTTNDSQSFVIIPCCVISYTLFGLMCTNQILLFLPCLNRHHIPLFRGGHFGVFWGLFWHITSTFWEPFIIFCETLCRSSWCFFWGSLHNFFHIMTLLGSFRGYFRAHFGQCLSNTS